MSNTGIHSPDTLMDETPEKVEFFYCLLILVNKMSKFISETDIEQNKKAIKEAWDATRKEGDPEEPPEPPPVDNRALYYRLEEQRLKKQEEYDDAHRLKNMVRGLEDEEIEFLDLVDRTKMEQERKLKEEERNALTEFRKRQVEMEAEQTSKLIAATVTSTNPSKKQTPKNSQKALLLGAVRKISDSSPPSKRLKIDEATNVEATKSEKNTSIVTSPNNSNVIHANGKANLICSGILPGLGHYSDSSENSDDSSNSDSSDPEEEEDHNHKKDLTGRPIVIQQQGEGGCC